MKAVIYTEYGLPDVLQIREVERPAPKKNEVLIKVYATALNSYDWRLLRAKPFLVRMMGGGLIKPKNTILGADIAGRIEAVGQNVTQFKIGDEVFGCLSGCGNGGLAEYVCADENALALKPEKVAFEKVAALPMAALTALQGLRDKGCIQQGKKVLINGASGGVGTFAIQIAKFFGAEVTGVCSTRNIETARSIGADCVIDYTKDDFTKNKKQYDIILDVAANRSVPDYLKALTSNGICSIIGFSNLTHMFQVMLFGLIPRKKKISMLSMKLEKKDLIFMSNLIEEEKVEPVIDRCYGFEETAEALRYIGQGHAQGKVIIKIA